MHPLIASVLIFTTTVLGAAAADSLPEPAQLPGSVEPSDPLLMRNGERVTTKEQWKEQRVPELRALFQYYMYGRQPGQARPTEWKVIREDQSALGGKATLKEVLVDCGLAAPVHLLIVVPNKRDRPAPVFLGLNFGGNYTLLADPQVMVPQGWVPEKQAGAPDNRAGEKGRGSKADGWAIEQSIDRGYAVATFPRPQSGSGRAASSGKKRLPLLRTGNGARAPLADQTVSHSTKSSRLASDTGALGGLKQRFSRGARGRLRRRCACVVWRL